MPKRKIKDYERPSDEELIRILSAAVTQMTHAMDMMASKGGADAYGTAMIGLCVAMRYLGWDWYPPGMVPMDDDDA